MDRFHIYEEIGKGSKSQIYKGRERNSIKYVGIKRVDKSELGAVSRQVAMLHRFDSPHVLKFHDWYETR
jgi:serine/threonine-protein kinase ULK4